MTRRWGLALGVAMATTVTPAFAQFSAASRTTLTVGTDPYGVSAADFNGDGRTDLAVVNGTSSSLSIYLHDTTPRGFIQEGSPLAVSAGPNYAVVADFNGDQRADVAVGGFVGNSISLLLRKSDGGFTASSTTLSVSKPVGVVVADFNGDQHLDLASASLDEGALGASVFLGMGGGGFAAESLPVLPGPSRFVVSADFDKDGKPDLAFAHGTTGKISVLLRGTTGFVQEPGSPYAVGTGPFTMVAADFDGDGRPDLAVTNSEDDSVAVLLRKATGGFSTAPGSPFAVGAGPAGIAAGDLDLDGHLDLAVASSIAGSVTILRGHGDGTFTAKAPLTDLASAHGVTVADFDGDAKPDLAVTQSAGGIVAVFFNETVPDAGVDAGNATPIDAATPAEDAGGEDAGPTPIGPAPDDDGCSCSHVASRPAGALAALPFVAALAAALRRRAHARRRAPPAA